MLGLFEKKNSACAKGAKKERPGEQAKGKPPLGGWWGES